MPRGPSAKGGTGVRRIGFKVGFVIADGDGWIAPWRAIIGLTASATMQIDDLRLILLYHHQLFLDHIFFRIE